MNDIHHGLYLRYLNERFEGETFEQWMERNGFKPEDLE